MTKKNYCHITLEQRYKIDALLKAGHKAPFISGQLNVDRSTIYRELGRNRTKTGCYSSSSAHEIAEEKKERVLAAGCDGYLSKPISKKLLLQKVSEFIDI